MKTILPAAAAALSLCGSLNSVMANPWKFERGNAKVEVDAQRSGQIVRWEFGGKVLVDATAPQSPLALEMASGERSSFVAERAETERDGVRVRGRLGTGAGSTPAAVAYRIEEDGRRIRVQWQVEKPGAAVHEAAWTLPLALSPRKRIWFRGDYGLEWDTRYFYQFMAGATGKPLARPDRNEWRYFSLDKLGPNAFQLWKAESTRTSPLMLQQGRHATPAVQVYNADGGVTIEYPQWSGDAPQSLHMDAAGGAAVSVLFWPKSALPAAPEQPGVFGTTHEVVLSAQSSEAASLAAQKELSVRYPAPPAPTPEQAMEEEAWLRTAPQSGALQYVTGGYPFAPGALHDAKKLRVEVGGKNVPVQAKPLAFWPDASLKWVLLTFPVDAVRAVESCPAPRVSLRNGKFLPVVITQSGKAASLSSTLRVEQGNGSAKIINGDWNVELATGAQWLRALHYKDQSLLRGAPELRQAYSDYQLDPAAVLPFERKAEGGERDAGALRVESVVVEESGPLRAVVRLEGMTTNQEPTRIILRVEVLAGRPELRLTHSAEFRFKDPRRTFLTGMGVSLPLVGGKMTDANLSGKNIGGVDEALALQGSMEHSEILSRRGGQWHSSAAGEAAHGWAQVKTDQIEITGAIRNFRQTAPKAMAVDTRSGALRFELWPEEAAPMDVRRYSDYPHLGQGESVPSDESWVDEKYYSQDPFVGVTRTHEMLLAFWPEAMAPKPETLAADFQSPPLLYAGWKSYQDTGVVLPVPSEREWPRAWQAWTRLANFWLWHRELHRWYGFWDFGDIRHYFQGGYGWTVAPATLAQDQPWKTPNAALDRAVVRLDYQPPNDWAYDNGRWGWGNTEGLPNLFLQQEYLRHGNRAVYFASEAMARHARDVVTRHEGQWFGQGTRHGVQHWSDGNHEERQTTITEYRLNYFLSGDGRSRDTINKLYDGVYSKTPVSVHAAHSGRLGGLLFHWEITGSPQEAAQLQRYVKLFLSPQGIYIAPSVKFPGPVVAAPPRELNGDSMFFHYFGGMHALIEYQQITHDAELSAALIHMADAALSTPDAQRRYKDGKDGGLLPAIAFAAAHASEPAPYRKLLGDYLSAGGWQNAYQTVTQNPAHWSGETGYLAGGVAGSWFLNNWMPSAAQSLDAPEIWSPAIEEKFEEREKNGNPAARLRPGWQSEYDGLPGVEEYLNSQQPWRKGE
jgi:hypothetical protein